MLEDSAPSVLLEKGLPCWRDQCGSSDAVARYMDEDGTRERQHCFSCGETRFIDHQDYRRPVPRRSSPVSADVEDLIQSAHLRSLPKRDISQSTCEKWGYLCRQTTKGWQQLAIYRDPHGHPVGVKVRPEVKDDMFWVGSSKTNLWGRHLWGSGGKKVVITEGEIDAMTVSQAQDHQWPVVSLPNGAAEAPKAIAHNLEWLSTFDQVLLGFDMDEPGREACLAAAKILPAGKAYIIRWTQKDANEMLLKGEGANITRCIWQAEMFRPDGILDARTLTPECLKPPTMGVPWAHPEMTRWTLGRRGGELYTFGAGTGLGKSDFLAEQIAATLQGKNREGDQWAPEAFAVFGYESGPANTKMQVAGKIAKRRFQFPQGHPDCMWEEGEIESVLGFMDKTMWERGGKLFILDSKGAADWELVKDHCRFLKHAEGVTNFLVDPIGALVVDEDEERKFLDRATLEGARMAVELDAKVYFVSHLTRPQDGPSHEEGGHVRLRQFRGSNGVGMYSSFVIGLERNQQADTPTERCTTTIRSVKDRLTGNSTGETFRLFYDRISGTLDPEQLEPLGQISEEDKALI